MRYILASVLIAALHSTGLAQTSTFSFVGRSWPIGLSNSYSFANGTIGFTVAPTNQSSPLALYNGVQTPNIFQGTFGGSAVSTSVLALALDDNGNNAGATNVINFNYPGGVKNVSFTMFGIDAGTGFNDKITVTIKRNGIQLSNSLITITAFNPSFVSAAGNIATGIAGPVPDTGAGSGNANATFQINASTIIDEIDLLWNGGSNKTYHTVFFSDISFAAVPEPTTWALIGISTLGAGAFMWRKKRNAFKAENTELKV